MVLTTGTAGAVPPLARVLALQGIDHPASTVRRACRPVRSRLAGRWDRADGSPTGAALEWLAEQAYGYRPSGARSTRRAASAGAMYPIELCWLTGGRDSWRLYAHDFGRRTVLRSPADAGVLARRLGLTDGQSALLPVAVLWRTAQRYGFRGYRYCLLDTAQVLGNVGALVAAAGIGCRQLTLDAGRPVGGALGLGATELLMPGLVLEPGIERFADLLLPAGPTAGPMTVGAGPVQSLEESPGLAPVLSRMHQLHRRSEPAAEAGLDLARLVERGSLEEIVRSLDGRRSARAFGPDDLPNDQWQHLRVEISDFLDGLPGRLVRALDVRLVRRAGAEPTTEALTAGSAPVRAGSTVDGPGLQAIFGHQPLAASAAGYLVVGLAGRTTPAADLPTYRQALLAAGLLVSRIYRSAVAVGVATTAIGGFDDRATADLAGGGFHPLIVQAIGTPHDGVDIKNDTVAATWLRPVGAAHRAGRRIEDRGMS